MVEITLKGRLKNASEFNEEKRELYWKEGRMVLKTSRGGQDGKEKSYYSIPLKIEEKNGERVENQFDSIMLIFWEDRISSQDWQAAANLKENQLITVSGEVGGKDDGLLTVKGIGEEEDNEGDVFI